MTERKVQYSMLKEGNQKMREKGPKGRKVLYVTKRKGKRKERETKEVGKQKNGKKKEEIKEKGK